MPFSFFIFTHTSVSQSTVGQLKLSVLLVRARVSLSLSLSLSFLSLFIRTRRTHTHVRAHYSPQKEEKERGIMGWGEDDRTATDTNNPWHSSHGMTQSKADVAESWVKKNDDSNATSTTTTTTTTKPLQLSKEVEEALSFAKRTKEKTQQQRYKNNNNNHSKTSKSSNNKKDQQKNIPSSSLQQKQHARKVVFAPAPSRPVWTAAPPVAATTTSLDAKAQHFQASPSDDNNNNDDGVQWPETAENNGGKHDGKDYLPKMTAESLRIEARKSKVDKFGKIPCRVCGRRFAEFSHLASHLYSSHYGLNDPDRVIVIDAERIARGHLTEHERVEEEKVKKKRTTIDLSEIVSSGNKSINAGGGGISAMLGGLGLYFKEGKAKKNDKASLLAKKVEGRPKHGGELMANPNAAMASATLVRRGKERMDGKKKKRATKLRKIILISRANKKKFKEEEDSTIEVSIEVGKVYVNIKVDEEDNERVKVDLWYDEDDHDDDDGDSDVDKNKAIVDKAVDTTNSCNDDTKTGAVDKKNKEGAYIISSTSSQTVIQLPSIWTKKSFIDIFKQKESDVVNTTSGSNGADEQITEKKKKKKKVVPKFCEMCKIECTSETSWVDHVAGKKHAKMLERKEKIDRGETTEEQIQRDHRRVKELSFIDKVEKMPKYASQVITTPLNQAVRALFSELRRLQERLYKTDPIKAKSKKRFTFGLREVVKNVELGKCKAVVVAPNIESTGDLEGGLDDQIWQIVKKCRELNTPVLFALTRSRLGKLCGPRYVSCVAVLNTDGLEDQLKDMLREGEVAQKKYTDESASAEEKEDT